MMKNDVYLIFAFLFISTLLSLTSCDECDGENPRARIVNNGSETASVQIKTSGGNTENINNVDGGASSEYKSYDAGEVTFTIAFDKEDIVEKVNMQACYEYDVVINSDNKITTSATDRNE
jgi:hypothetical protein